MWHNLFVWGKHYETCISNLVFFSFLMITFVRELVRIYLPRDHYLLGLTYKAKSE